MNSTRSEQAERQEPPVGICIYAMNYAPELTGTGRYTGDLGAYLADAGIEVTVVTTPPHYPGWRVGLQGYRNGWRVERSSAAHVYRCPLFLHERMSGIRRLLAPLSFVLSSAPVFLWAVVARRPRAIVVVEPTLLVAPVALFGAWLVGARTVLHVQDLEMDAAFAVGHLSSGRWVRRIAKNVERWLTQRFDDIVTISGRMRSRLLERDISAAKVHIIRNWVDLERIFPVQEISRYRVELGIGTDIFVALYSGNIGAKQGMETLLDAARHLEGRKEFLIVVAGDGPMRERIEAHAEEAANVLWLPLQPEHRFNEFLALADLHLVTQAASVADLVLPSKLGALLASGRPVTVTAKRDSELGEFLGDSCRLISPDDATALADSIVAAASQPDPITSRQRRLELAKSLARPDTLARFASLLLGPTEG